MTPDCLKESLRSLWQERINSASFLEVVCPLLDPEAAFERNRLHLIRTPGFEMGFDLKDKRKL